MLHCDLADTVQEVKDKIIQIVRSVEECNLKNIYKNIENRLCNVLREEDLHFDHLVN